MTADPIREFLISRIEQGDFPSASWIVRQGGEVISSGAAGAAVCGPEEMAATPETIYDLASLTKPLATGLLASIYAGRGEMSFEDPVSKYILEFGRHDSAELTIADLLTHRSGFAAWRPLYLEAAGDTRAARLEAISRLIADLQPEAPRRAKVIYSDLNFILLCRILELAGGSSLEDLFRKEIAESLELTETGFNPPDELLPRIAASETGNRYEMQISREMGFEVEDYPWRQSEIRGEVHDGNCFFLGGVSGHAGLFSTAAEVARLAAEFLPGSSLLGDESLGMFSTDLTPGLGQARSIAFQLASTPGSTANGILNDTAFGHLGFTGTMVWIEQGTERIFVLLTNRTHCRELPFADLSASRRGFLELASGL